MLSCTGYCVQATVYRLLCTGYRVQATVYRLLCAIYALCVQKVAIKNMVGMVTSCIQLR